MSRLHFNALGLVAWPVACLSLAALAEQLSNSPPSTGATVVAQAPAVPMPPPAKCPVEFFRELLAKPAAIRVQFLTNRPPASQKLILAKLSEYEALDADERELRLRATELHWYLLPLMSAPATERPAQLARIPEELRPLVVDRLQRWDTLPPDAQKELLLSAANYLSILPAGPAVRRAEVQDRLSPERRAKLEAELRDWQTRSKTQRQELASRFEDFFELTPQEREKALSSLSEPERRQIKNTFERFWTLSPPQRASCVRGFKKFATFGPVERQRFLENTMLWEQMTPSERQNWKDLVYSFGPLPPLPPGLGSPPLPPRAAPRLPPAPPVATNR